MLCLFFKTLFSNLIKNRRALIQAPRVFVVFIIVMMVFSLLSSLIALDSTILLINMQILLVSSAFIAAPAIFCYYLTMAMLDREIDREPEPGLCMLLYLFIVTELCSNASYLGVYHVKTHHGNSNLYLIKFFGIYGVSLIALYCCLILSACHCAYTNLRDSILAGESPYDFDENMPILSSV